MTTYQGILDKQPATLAKRLAKTGIGTLKGVALNDYLVNTRRMKIDRLWADGLREAGIGFEVRGGADDVPLMSQYIRRRIAQQERKLAAAEKALGDLTLRNGTSRFAVKVGESFAEGYLKDISKEVMKRLVGEFFQGAAFRRYVEAQAALTATSRSLLATSTMYWETKDLYEFQLALRDAILDGYRPDETLKVLKNELFDPSQGATFRLIDQHGSFSDITEREIEARFGGVPMQRTGGRLEFHLPGDAADRIRTGPGDTADLDIVVLQ